MNYSLKISSLILSTVLFLVSCGGSNDKEYLPPVKVEIPDEIKNDKDLLTLVETSETAINKFSIDMEDLMFDVVEIFDTPEKTADDLSAFEKIEVAKIYANFLAKSAESLQIIEKLQSYSEEMLQQGKPLSEEKVKALEVIAKTYKDRMQLLEEKYEKLQNK